MKLRQYFKSAILATFLISPVLVGLKGAVIPVMLWRNFTWKVHCTLACFFLLGIGSTFAQSTDVRFPTPVDSAEVLGSIPARDLGDARLTDHFYTFNGVPGDLLITIESKNLNGDFDVFTAAELRPVLKVVVYAESSSAITKNIYLRKPESMILRVEARTPNDDEGTYRIRFSGSFAPTAPALNADARPPERTESRGSMSGDRKTTRVNSAGARIEEPPVEVASAPTPEPTPAPVVEESPAKTVKTTPPRTARVRRPAPRRSPTKPANTGETRTATTESPAKTKDVESPTEASPESPEPPARTTRTTRRPTARTARSGTRNTKPVVTAENGQLIIEVKDGTRVQFAMSTVARVTIENGEVVIVTHDGYERRVPLSNVLRMSIGP